MHYSFVISARGFVPSPPAVFFTAKLPKRMYGCRLYRLDIFFFQSSGKDGIVLFFLTKVLEGTFLPRLEVILP